MKKPGFKSLLVVAGLALVVTYQNCGWEMENTMNDGASTGGRPFAYSAQIDRVAYLSCDQNTGDTTMFTLKAGAYNTTSAGIRLRPEFRNEVAGYAINRRIEAMNEDAHNRDAQLQIGLRPASDLENYMMLGTQAMVKNVLSQLNVSPIAPDLAALGANQYLPDSKYSFKTSFQLGDANSNALRDQFSSQQTVLTTTYLAPGERYVARKYETKTPGHAYQLNFNCGPSNIHVLCQVGETDLLTGNPVGSWDCPANFHFRVVRNGDAGAAGCSNFGAVPGTGTTEYEIYTQVRNILGSGWAVDMTNRCVMPTTGTCYPAGPVDYASSGNCDQTGQPTCVRHFSVCLKRS
ncbi:MAG TPA: hypothetical protein VFV50_10940 [Bdellovibrionales bacterium]|nr:hypothetical protein [Bdellovibrionales bacterium]